MIIRRNLQQIRLGSAYIYIVCLLSYRIKLTYHCLPLAAFELTGFPLHIINAGCPFSYEWYDTILHVHHSFTEESDPNPRATLCKALCSMTTAAAPSSCGQKRKRTVIQAQEHSTIATSSPQPPWKRAKKPFQSRQEANTAYWDSLSKLWFTRRALKELNRRNRQTANPTSIRRPDRTREPATLENSSSQIKRFARHGGPDLRDLRGVDSTHVVSR